VISLPWLTWCGLTAVAMDMTAFFHGVIEKIVLMGDDHVRNVQVLEDVNEAVPGGVIEARGGLVQQE